MTPLEELSLDGTFALVTNNISMHECRDADQVTERVRGLLEPGGWFVISDFSFPVDDAGLRSVPGRVMSGIQFFEAQIDDQLLPRSAYDDLLIASRLHRPRLAPADPDARRHLRPRTRQLRCSRWLRCEGA